MQHYILLRVLVSGLIGYACCVSLVSCSNNTSNTAPPLPPWLQEKFLRQADEYLQDFNAEAIARQLIVSDQPGYGGLLLYPGAKAPVKNSTLPPLRILKANEFGREHLYLSGDQYATSLALASGLAAGRENAVKMFSRAHVQEIFNAKPQIIFDSPLSWAHQLPSDWYTADKGTLSEISDWIRSSRSSPKLTPKQTSELSESLADAFEASMRDWQIEVAHALDTVPNFSVRLGPAASSSLSDSIFQISYRISDWEVAQAVVSQNPELSVDSLLSLTKGEVKALRLAARNLVAYRFFILEHALTMPQQAPLLSSSIGLRQNTRQTDDRKKPTILLGAKRSPDEIENVEDLESPIDSARFRALLRRAAPVLLQQAASDSLPWQTFPKRLLVLNASGEEDAILQRSIDFYGTAYWVDLACRGLSTLDPSQYDKILFLAGPQLSLDSLQVISAWLALQDTLGSVSLIVGAPERIEFFKSGINDPFSTLIYSPQADRGDWRHMLAIPFGGSGVSGRMPKQTDSFAEGAGDTLLSTRIQPLDLLTTGIDVIKLTDIDAIVNSAIRVGASPGAQVSVVYNNQLVYDKGFGKLAPNDREVLPTDLYDLASLTKVTATTLMAMKLVEEDSIGLDKPIRTYLNGLPAKTGALKVSQLLRHATGLQRDLPIQKELRAGLRKFQAVNCRGKYCSKATRVYTVPVAKSVFYDKNSQQRMYAAAMRIQPNQRNRYGDLNFFLLQQVLESAAGVSLDRYVDSVFYHPMGLELGFKPMKNGYDEVLAARIAPTEYDWFWRRQRIRGYVHDEAAALQGGVGGHAGNFGSARDVAILFEMLANGGSYGGRRYFHPNTIQTFTSSKKGEARALGFAKIDRPTTKSKSGVFPLFGHTGFTGTSVWSDPELGITISFTSNRIYGGKGNWRLQRDKVRERIMRVVYEAAGV